MAVFSKLNTNIRELISGASVNFVAKILATILGLISSVLLARFYGAETVGTIATITSIVNIGTIFALAGFGTLAMKLISTTTSKTYIGNTQRLYLKLLLINTSHGILVGSTLFFFLTRTSLTGQLNLQANPLLPSVIILFTTLLAISSNTLRGLGDYKKYSSLDFSGSLFVILIVTASILTNASSHAIVHVYFSAQVLACFLAFFLVAVQFSSMRKQIDLDIDQQEPTPKVKNLYTQALPMLGVAASQILILNIDILFIGYFRSQESVGVYSVYIKLVAITAFATSAINSMFAPKVAVLFDQGKTDALKTFVKQTTLISSALVVFLAGSMLFGHKFILKLYNNVFLENLSAMYILLTSTVIHSCFGAVGFFLNMTGQQRVFLKIMLLACMVNITLNLLLVPNFGMQGAAIATLMTTILWNFIATVVIFKKIKYTLLPFSLKP